MSAPAGDLEAAEPPAPVPPIVWTPTEKRYAAAAAVGVLLQSVRYYATLPLLGYLLTRPLRYILIHPSTPALVIAGAYARTGRDPVWLVVVAGVASLAVVDPLRWLAGARYGDRIARLIAGGARAPEPGSRGDVIGRVERFVARWGTWALVLAWFTPIPLLFIQLAAGASGMSLRRFLIADVLGTLLWVLSLAGLGYAIGQPAVDTVKSIAHYSLYVTIAAVVLAVGLAGLRGARIAR